MTGLVRDHPLSVHERLRRIARQDAVLGAWCAFGPAGAGATPSADAASGGALDGVPFGVKDNIDVQGLATRAGSAARGDAAPAPADAEVVRRLRAHGALPLGKTVTTEFAFRDPTATCNPYHRAHTPGGSSSGSAAAVGAAMVPFALATQTAGSLNRPAAYCGVVGIKPSYGLLPTQGLTPLSPAFDTIGVISGRLATGAQALAAMAGQAGLAHAAMPVAPRLACLPAHAHASSSPAVQAFHAQTLAAIRAAGVAVDEVALAVDLQAVVADHRTVMLAEAHACHGALLRARAALLQPEFRAALVQGAAVCARELAAAGQRIAAAREQVWNQLAGYGAIVLQPVPASAPRGLGSTGDQSYLTPWTAFWGPTVTVPGQLDAQGLPLATMLAGAPGQDGPVLALAAWLDGLVNRMPAPTAWAAGS